MMADTEEHAMSVLPNDSIGHEGNGNTQTQTYESFNTINNGETQKRKRDLNTSQVSKLPTAEDLKSALFLVGEILAVSSTLLIISSSSAGIGAAALANHSNDYDVKTITKINTITTAILLPIMVLCYFILTQKKHPIHSWPDKLPFLLLPFMISVPSAMLGHIIFARNDNATANKQLGSAALGAFFWSLSGATGMGLFSLKKHAGSIKEMAAKYYNSEYATPLLPTAGNN